jgi:ABC-type multidrug transport system, ATPase and permease components
LSSKRDIFFDGIDIKKIKIDSLRKMMGIVTQETILLDDTIKYNISYGTENVNEEAILKASVAANALDFINDLSLGFNTVIGEKGVKLSGGQRQRIAIARAILKNPPFLILDEATSSLDTESEKLVQKAIENLMNKRTVLVIAHRLSTIRNADKILMISNGEILEYGTHDELFQSDGEYKKLYNLQYSE